MTVRQISGCSNLIKILNGLWHCVSLPATMAYDSALTQLSMNTFSYLSKDFAKNEYVNFVYDNIDFGEETAKQTHVTNGIITQKVMVIIIITKLLLHIYNSAILSLYFVLQNLKNSYMSYLGECRKIKHVSKLKTVSRLRSRTEIKNTQRKVKVPTTDIAPYIIGTKKTPAFIDLETNDQSLKISLNDCKQIAQKMI